MAHFALLDACSGFAWLPTPQLTEDCRTVVLFASNLLLSNQLKLPVYPLETGDQAHAEALKLNR